MKKYNIDVEKFYKCSETFEIEAGSKEEALRKIQKLLENYSFDVFEEVDMVIHDPYWNCGI